MTVQKYDWERVHLEYVSGRESGDGLLERPTLEALSQHYNIPLGTLRNRAHREGWVEERNLFVTSLLHKTREKTLEQLAEKASQLDLLAFNVARAMLFRAAGELRDGMEGGRLTLADWERLLRMCDTAHRLGRRALGAGDTSQ